MPRLVGRTSKTPLYTLIAALALATVAVLEYSGEINLVPGFGRDNPAMRSTNFDDYQPNRSVSP
jgi:hypothetical protein